MKVLLYHHYNIIIIIIIININNDIGNSVTLEELKDFFRFILNKMEQIDEKISIKEASLRLIPHILQSPKDFYKTAMMKEAFQCSINMVSYVEMPHYIPI